MDAAHGPSRRTVLAAGMAAGIAGLLAIGGLVPDDLDSEVSALAARRRADALFPAVEEAAAHAVLAPRSPATHHRHRHRPIRSLTDADRLLHRHAFAHSAVMLTLDDGPHPVWTPRMLALLEHLGITATFFMIGSQVHRHPGVAREVAARGHVIGNHTWTHDEQLATRPASRIRSEIERTSHAIHHACGVVPTQFRAPGGNWGTPLLDALADHHLQPVGWDIDPMDWARPGTRSITRTLSHLRPHDIALCHDGGGDRSQTYRALRTVLPRLQRRGYTFVTLPPRLAGTPR